MTEVDKILNQKCNMNTTVNFDFIKGSVTRGNTYTLKQSHCNYDFSTNKINRIIATWNSLPPDYVVDALNIITFNNRLDKHWCMQNVVFGFDLCRIENHSFMY